MDSNKGFRPQAKLHKRPWLFKDGTSTPGIALMHRHKVLAHMTPAEARAIADKLHDIVDQLEKDEN